MLVLIACESKWGQERERERGCVYLLQRYGDDVREEEGEGGRENEGLGALEEKSRRRCQNKYSQKIEKKRLDLQGTVHVPFPTKHETFWSGVSTNSVTIPCRLLRRTGETAGCVLAPYACTLQGELQPANQPTRAARPPRSCCLTGTGPRRAQAPKHLFTPPVSIHYMYITVHHAMPACPAFAQPDSQPALALDPLASLQVGQGRERREAYS